mmetsp:Transcript_42418/g.165619  ORF Transcript_42418/g.165619 Transcript_42418/m.165619 type:complete len:224 (-) Transcript_42418:363-1034(-)
MRLNPVLNTRWDLREKRLDFSVFPIRAFPEHKRLATSFKSWSSYKQNTGLLPNFVRELTSLTVVDIGYSELAINLVPEVQSSSELLVCHRIGHAPGSNNQFSRADNSHRVAEVGTSDEKVRNQLAPLLVHASLGVPSEQIRRTRSRPKCRPERTSYKKKLATRVEAEPEIGQSSGILRNQGLSVRNCATLEPLVDFHSSCPIPSSKLATKKKVAIFEDSLAEE